MTGYFVMMMMILSSLTEPLSSFDLVFTGWFIIIIIIWSSHHWLNHHHYNHHLIFHHFLGHYHRLILCLLSGTLSSSDLAFSGWIIVIIIWLCFNRLDHHHHHHRHLILLPLAGSLSTFGLVFTDWISIIWSCIRWLNYHHHHLILFSLARSLLSSLDIAFTGSTIIIILSCLYWLYHNYHHHHHHHRHLFLPALTETSYLS